MDQVWLCTAERVGLTVVRSDQVYAHSDAGVLHIGTAETLDPDDCIAQMVLHELCHAMVEGPQSLTLPDWGLDNTSPKDLVREHACLRLQASLAGGYGLRPFLAATTVFRRYYDALPQDPLAAGEDPAIALARAGAEVSKASPFFPHVGQALQATRTIVEASAGFLGSEPQDELPSMMRLDAPLVVGP